jgi:tRNA uridine 5-carbamoylmethylation protein Kti12
MRDEILISIFGKTALAQHEHIHAKKVIFEMIINIISSTKNALIILDFWNGYSKERVAMIRELKEMGVTKVFCWQFQVDIETCLKWFFQKPDSAEYSETRVKHDYSLYYEMAKGIINDGFDKVFKINPLKPIILSEIME